jgi:hypothetical protein
MTIKRLLPFAGSTIFGVMVLFACNSSNMQSENQDMGSAADLAASPAPVLSQVSPQAASNVGGATLTLTGENFQPGATVMIGGVPATGVTVVSSTQITCTVPKKAATCGPVAIVVINPDGKSAQNPNLFSYTSSAFGFAAATSFTMGMTPRQVITPDLDGDGNPDLVTVNSGSGDMSIRFGMGNGMFSAVTTVNLGGGSPYAVAAADLNADQKIDLVSAHNNANSIKVIKGMGNRAFAAPTAAETFTAGAGPIALALGDIDGQNGPDAVVANNGSNNVSLLLNTGQGAFSAQTTSSTGNQPTSVILARFVDQKLDYATANKNSNNAIVRTNSGSGGFSATSTTVMGLNAPTDLVAGDWNGDQKIDLAVVNSGAASLLIALGAGNGTFINTVTPAVGTGTSNRTIAAADMNQDGKLDLLVANETAGDVSILLGMGDGTFAAQMQFPISTTPGSLSVADLNKDGLPDLVATDRGNNAVMVRLNQCQ